MSMHMSADADQVTAATTAAGMGGPVGQSHFEAAVQTRQKLGRLNDLIHTAGISLILPRLLVKGERLANRPSLAAGNDASRPFDVETDLRIMEFKFGVWQPGLNASRKRAVFHDLVHLAADQSGRRASSSSSGLSQRRSYERPSLRSRSCSTVRRRRPEPCTKNASVPMTGQSLSSPAGLPRT